MGDFPEFCESNSAVLKIDGFLGTRGTPSKGVSEFCRGSYLVKKKGGKN